MSILCGVSGEGNRNRCGDLAPELDSCLRNQLGHRRDSVYHQKRVADWKACAQYRRGEIPQRFSTYHRGHSYYMQCFPVAAEFKPLGTSKQHRYRYRGNHTTLQVAKTEWEGG